MHWFVDAGLQTSNLKLLNMQNASLLRLIILFYYHRKSLEIRLFTGSVALFEYQSHSWQLGYNN